MTTFEAKYYGTCTICARTTEPGDMVRFDENRDVVHEECYLDDADGTRVTVRDSGGGVAARRETVESLSAWAIGLSEPQFTPRWRVREQVICPTCHLLHAGECM